jgi:hypothetical protein
MGVKTGSNWRPIQMIEQVPVDMLKARYSRVPCHVIGRISFEQRSIVVAEALGMDGCATFVPFISLKRSEVSERNLAKFRTLHPTAIPIELDTSHPLQTAELLAEVVRLANQRAGMSDTIIDISSFRREELLMLLAIFRQSNTPKDTKCELVYVATKDMSDTLSNDVIGHRSVIGYAGEMWPSRQTRLVVLMGFEIHRARSIIENYEPAEIVLGMGRESESINPALHGVNLSFFKELRRQSANVISTFEFSARDPLMVASELESAVPYDVESNVVIAPLNTKLSTLGAGLYALNHPTVQVCYAAVREYNESKYSTPDEFAYVVGLKDLL